MKLVLSPAKFLGYTPKIQRNFCRTMNFVNELDCLKRQNVHIKDADRVNKIISEIVENGTGKLQVVSDFDQTITKQHENGKKHISSFGMFDHCPSLTPEYKKTVKELNEKFYPLEMDPTIPITEKYKHMEEWWNLSEEALKGMKVTIAEIDKVCYELAPSLRDGTKEVFDTLSQEKIPVLVFSAGLGDTVQAVLNHAKILLPNVKIVSNFLKYNENGTIEGFQDSVIHVFNKNEYAIKNSDFYHLIEDRNNVILLGDSIGDAKMADGITNVHNVLKIGFLYERSKEALPHYMETFDIVLEDDQTMEVFKAILECICDKKN